VSNHQNGFGIAQYPDGYRYEGQFSNDEKHGTGVYTFAADGYKYEGEWSHNTQHGIGIATYPDGDSYMGEFKDGQKHGRGKINFITGGLYEGEFALGAHHGLGTAVYENGDQYAGIWVRGKPEGMGTASYTNGNIYEGTWKDGKKDGFGILKVTNAGQMYEGGWSKGVQHGKGVTTLADGRRIEGTWEDGLWEGDGVVLNDGTDTTDGAEDGPFPWPLDTWPNGLMLLLTMVVCWCVPGYTKRLFAPSQQKLEAELLNAEVATAKGTRGAKGKGRGRGRGKPTPRKGALAGSVSEERRGSGDRESSATTNAREEVDSAESLKWRKKEQERLIKDAEAEVEAFKEAGKARREREEMRKRVTAPVFVPGYVKKQEKLKAEGERQALLAKQKAEAPRDEENVGCLTVFLHTQLGEGSCGTKVYKGRHADGREVAVKVMLQSAVPEHRARREMLLLQELAESTGRGRDFVIQYRCIEHTPGKLLLGMELCECSLHDVISERKEQVPLKQQVRIVSELSMAVGFLHERKIVHRDVRPKNVLLKKDGFKGTVKLSDFGLSMGVDTKVGRVVGSYALPRAVCSVQCVAIVYRVVNDPEAYSITHYSLLCRVASCKCIPQELDQSFSSTTAPQHEIGSFGYYAPEVYRKQKVTAAVDVFSLGCCIFYVFSHGGRPFEDPEDPTNKFLLNNNILNGISDLSRIEHCVEAVDLVAQMVDIEAHLRPTMLKALEHPLFWGHEHRLQFLCAVGKEDDVMSNSAGARAVLPPASELVPNGDWGACIPRVLWDHYMYERLYDVTSTAHLVSVLYVLAIYGS
jgi:serine/threonine protein kinase